MTSGLKVFLSTLPIESINIQQRIISEFTPLTNKLDAVLNFDKDINEAILKYQNDLVNVLAILLLW